MIRLTEMTMQGLKKANQSFQRAYPQTITAVLQEEEEDWGEAAAKDGGTAPEAEKVAAVVAREDVNLSLCGLPHDLEKQRTKWCPLFALQFVPAKISFTIQSV